MGPCRLRAKAQMRGANHSGARFAVIIGDDEFAKGAGMVKDLSGEGEQQQLAIADIPAYLAAKLRA